MKTKRMILKERGTRLMARAFRELEVPRHVCRGCALAVLRHGSARRAMLQGLLLAVPERERRRLNTA